MVCFVFIYLFYFCFRLEELKIVRIKRKNELESMIEEKSKRICELNNKLRQHLKVLFKF